MSTLDMAALAALLRAVLQEKLRMELQVVVHLSLATPKSMQKFWPSIKHGKDSLRSAWQARNGKKRLDESVCGMWAERAQEVPTLMSIM
mmetsp:Transcript_20593/g.33973  ORF Transcript_20593/g.33973 Transcript_20593/m.33973 type:complete len:89 (-) Transcript_20593:14-280(-)